MNIALTLLMTAMSLLTQVSHSPNATPALRNEAITIANQAIGFAESVLNEPVTTVPVSTLINPTPVSPVQVPPIVFGSTGCTPNPVLTLSVATTSSRETFTGDYSTGCPLDPSTTFSYKQGDGQWLSDRGTILETDKGFYNANISENGNDWIINVYDVNPGNGLFSLTVGTSTISQ